VEFRADLADARFSRAGHKTELATTVRVDVIRASTEAAAWVCELRMVEDVEEFRANFKGQGFLNNSALRKAEVGIVESRSVEKLAIRIAELSQGAGGKGIW